MASLSLSDPLFASYAVAAGVMIVKTLAMAGMTTFQMTRLASGFRSPEDARQTPLNPVPRPGQVGLDDRVDRFRRIHQNDLENVPFFLTGGFLYILTDPPLALAQGLFAAYVATRLLHFWAYATAQIHDIRATLWTLGVLILLYLTLRVVWIAAGAL